MSREIQFFEQPITFMSQELDGSELVDKVVTKTAQFKELSRTQRDQHKLHFKIISVFSGASSNDSYIGDGKTASFTIDTDVIYDLTTKFIRLNHIPNENFTIQDREELLQDSGGLATFGLWLLAEKISPFFSELMGVKPA